MPQRTPKGGGAWYSHAALQEISQLCRARGIALHLDGARVFNAIVESKQYSARDLGQVSGALALLFNCFSCCSCLQAKEHIPPARTITRAS